VIPAGVYEGYVECLSGLLVVDGGGADIIEMRYSSKLEVRSTSPFVAGYGGIWDIRLKNMSNLNYYGGQTEELSMRNDATANLYGGRIDYISSFQTVPDVFVGYDEQGRPIFEKLRHIEMFVREYAYNPATLHLTGTWGDWTTFDIKLLNQAGYAPVIDNIKFTIIPEPASLVLLGLGGLLMRKRKAR
jgi:hypothetical protein